MDCLVGQSIVVIVTHDDRILSLSQSLVIIIESKPSHHSNNTVDVMTLRSFSHDDFLFVRSCANLNTILRDLATGIMILLIGYRAF